MMYWQAFFLVLQVVASVSRSARTTKKRRTNAMKMYWGLILPALLASIAHAGPPTSQFDNFFPGWRSDNNNILKYECHEELARYKSNERRPGSGQASLVNRVLDCILDAYMESHKAEMASAAVVLGLTPTLLQGIGSTVAETSLVGLRRPLLSALLALGSQVPKAGELSDGSLAGFVANTAQQHPLNPAVLDWDSLPTFSHLPLAILEYLAVAAAVGNIVHLTYTFGVHAVVVFAAATVYVPALWAGFAVVLQIAAIAIIHIRVRMMVPKASSSRGANSLLSIVRDEFTPSAFHMTKTLSWRGGRRSLLFRFLAWCLSIGILIQVLLGTLILSSILFFSVVDALSIVARYVVSGIVCRAVVRLELDGMKASLAKAPSRFRVGGGNNDTMGIKTRKRVKGTTDTYALVALPSPLT